MANCVGCCARPARARHLDHLSGDLRTVPSPEHGTSHKMRSYRRAAPAPAGLGIAYSSGKRAASHAVTSSGSQGWLYARRSVRSCRFASISLEIRMPTACAGAAPSVSPRGGCWWRTAHPSASSSDIIMSSICSVLPPGAAHMSSTK
eukprot:scaffold323390_cov24-Tisochrysis_lutea.AAC.3